ncbi:MAG: Crp/Fnr family transcriptional regulator, partial [Candidatus Rokubacteria bacterium]|nr:Crp/Fnr family transcriptional regulator [Candidatus Rokubacteria bacterium]
MDTDERTLELLKAAPCFKDLAPAVRGTIAARCRPLSLERDQLVFMEGEPCRSLYILESGKVKCYRANAEGREQVLEVLDRPGDTFCITSAFKTGKHIVTATAMTATRLRVLDLDTVKHLAQEHSSLALSLVATAGDQMKSLVTLAEDLSLKTATARLAKFLYEMALAEGERAGKETLVRRDCLREEEIASLLGIVRVHVSRSLKRLASTGAIALSREVVRIPDLTALKRLFEGGR